MSAHVDVGGGNFRSEGDAGVFKGVGELFFACDGLFYTALEAAKEVDFPACIGGGVEVFVPVVAGVGAIPVAAPDVGATRGEFGIVTCFDAFAGGTGGAEALAGGLDGGGVLQA